MEEVGNECRKYMAQETKLLVNEPTLERQRLQLDFTPDAFDRLQDIRVKAKARSNAEVVRNSIRLYEWFLQRLDEGYTLQIAKEDVVKEVEIVL